MSDELIKQAGFVAATIVSILGLLKAWKDFLDNQKEKLQIKVNGEVAIAKENSAGREAIRSLQLTDEEFKRRIDDVERDLDQGLNLAEKERDQLNQKLESLKREHTEFIGKSLEYFMGRKQ